MKWYKFEVITDQMFEWKYYNNIKDWIYKYFEDMKKCLFDMGIWYVMHHIEFIDWNSQPDRENADRNQYRFRVHIYKEKTKITRNQIFTNINKIYAPVYKKI